MISRRSWLALLGSLATPGVAFAFGEEGAFHPRLLTTAPGGSAVGLEVMLGAASRWAFELMERTSAPARISSEVVGPEASAFLLEPFALWIGESDPGELSPLALRRLAEFFRLGGQMIVDDRVPERGAFIEGATRELARVLPELGRAPLGADHVLYKSFYLLDRPYGRVLGPPQVEALVAGGLVRVLFLRHDLLGALARSGETWAYAVEPGGSLQREMAVRFAVNIAMHFLCSDYKDDQVHAPFLMRRRARSE
jgi:hypothetical protein